MRSIAMLAIGLYGVLGLNTKVQGQSEPIENRGQQGNSKSTGHWNVSTPTLGGKQFWTDHFVHGEWRIQKNVYTQHYRLLDPKNFRRAWGSYESCQNKFSELRQSESIEPLVGKAVILMHGLGRTRGSMAKLARHFKDAGYVPINVGYASTRAAIEDHADALHQIIGELKGIEEIYFVGHSMGNIIWRFYLSKYQDKMTGTQGDPRIKATVMIAPPNQGAYLARLLKPTGVFGLVTGKSGKELASKDWSKFAESLATPKHRFGIVAGKYNGNPLFRVDNDTTVSVDETKLTGATDFGIVNSMHATIMSNPEVIELASRFFEQGFLVSADKMNPLR